MIKDSEKALDHHFGLTNSYIAPDYIVEVGSFDGESLKSYGSFSPYSKLVGFECNPVNYFKSCLGKPNINLCAVSDTVGFMTIYMPRERHTHDTRYKRNIRGIKHEGHYSNFRCSGTRKVIDGVDFIENVVPCTTLDTFFKIPIEQGCTFSLIIDAEGAAYEILKGASAFLENTLSLKVELEKNISFENQKLDFDSLIFLNEFTQVGTNNSDGINQYNSYFCRDPLHASYFYSIEGEVPISKSL